MNAANVNGPSKASENLLQFCGVRGILGKQIRSTHSTHRLGQAWEVAVYSLDDVTVIGEMLKFAFVAFNVLKCNVAMMQ